jgi:hypothetical protein
VEAVFYKSFSFDHAKCTFIVEEWVFNFGGLMRSITAVICLVCITISTLPNKSLALEVGEHVALRRNAFDKIRGVVRVGRIQQITDNSVKVNLGRNEFLQNVAVSVSFEDIISLTAPIISEFTVDKKVRVGNTVMIGDDKYVEVWFILHINKTEYLVGRKFVEHHDNVIDAIERYTLTGSTSGTSAGQTDSRWITFGGELDIERYNSNFKMTELH